MLPNLQPTNQPTKSPSVILDTSGRCLLSWRRYLKAYGKHPGTADKRALCFNPSMRPSDFEERFIGKTSGISVGFRVENTPDFFDPEMVRVGKEFFPPLLFEGLGRLL